VAQDEGVWQLGSVMVFLGLRGPVLFWFLKGIRFKSI